MEKSKNDRRETGVPGDIPEPPDLELRQLCDRSLNASSLSSFESLFNVNSTFQQNQLSKISTAAQSSNLEFDDTQNLHPSTSFYQPTPTKVLPKVGSNENFSQPETSSISSGVPFRADELSEEDSRRVSSAEQSWRNHGLRVVGAYNSKKLHDRSLTEARENEEREQQVRSIQKHQSHKEEWVKLNAAATIKVVEDEIRREEKRKDRDQKLKYEFQQMLDRERNIGGASRPLQNEILSIPDTPLNENLAYCFVNPDLEYVTPTKSLAASTTKRKQTLVHRLVNNVKKPFLSTTYKPVVVADVVPPEVDLTAGTSVENLCFLNGEVLDLGCYGPGKELGKKAIQSYLTVLEAKNQPTSETRRTQIWNEDSVFGPTTPFNVFEDGTFRQVDERLWEVNECLLTAVKNGTEKTVGIVKIGKQSIAYLIDKGSRAIDVFDDQNSKLTTGFNKLKLQLESRLNDKDWMVNFKGPAMPYKLAEDSSVSALLALERIISGTDEMPGVKSLSDFRQKLKWLTISEADSCRRIVLQNNKEFARKVEDAVELMLLKVKTSKSLEELLANTEQFHQISSSLVCKSCCSTKNFKAITLSGTESKGQAFDSIKGRVTAHLRSEAHRKKIGLRITVPKEHADYDYRNAKTIDDILDLYPWLERTDDGSVACNACKLEKWGVFAVRKEDSSRFSSLKTTLRAHQNLETHRMNVACQTSSENRKIGMTNGLSAYICLKDSLELSQYERIVNTDYAKSVEIGDQNHSLGFVREMRPIFANLLRGTSKSQLHRRLESTGNLPKISVAADKYTEQGVSYHVIGALTHRNGVTYSYILNVKESTGDDGLSLANDIFETLKEYYTEEEMRKLVMGGSMDGGYMQAHVPEHLLDLMGVPEEDRDAYSFQWDKAHLLELAAKHARKEAASSNQLDWINRTFTIVSRIQGDFRQSNKALRELKELGASLQEAGAENINVLRKMQTHNDTRFATHLSRFYGAFEHNYALIHEFFKANNSTDLTTIAKPDFVLRLTGLMDVYSKLSKTSLKLQKINKMPWHAEEAIQSLIDDLTEIADICSKPNFVPNYEMVPKFSACSCEVIACQTFKGQKLDNTPMKRTRNTLEEAPLLEVVRREGQRVSQHAKTLAQQVEQSFRVKTGYPRRKSAAELPGADTVLKIGESFSIRKILSRNGSPPLELEELFQIYRSAQLIAPSVSKDVLASEYSRFCTEVIQDFSDIPDMEAETDYYFKKLDGSETNYPLLMEFISLSVNRNSVESVVESMCSQIKIIVNGRASLTVPNVCHEAIIRHNGPPAGPKAESLVEKALNVKFKDKPWKFIRSSSGKNSLKQYETASKVTDKLQSGNEKL